MRGSKLASAVRRKDGGKFVSSVGAFLSGFSQGIGALGLLSAPSFKPEHYKGDTVAQSWKAVSQYLTTAARQVK